ncbi:MAG: protein translocase subunit SecF [Gemmatimonadaceae bacterium]|nr:protein translocase subunit SecF [Gemmatimonadaceae bacterium]
MLRILHDTKIDFIRHWRTAIILTAAFVVIGFGSAFVNGWFTSSIEFTGGTLMRLKFVSAPNVGAIRSALDGAGVRGVEVQQYGDATTYTVRAQEAEQVAEQESGATGVSKKIEEALRSSLGAESFIVEDRMAVGPRVGAELTRGAVIAVLVSFMITLIYLAFRFDRNFGIAAVIATAHDILATIAFIKLMDLEISLTIIAAVLTVIGYSLNDTIIIFDRVRENLRKGKKEPLYDTLNRSVNETLPRSVLTHGTTIAATLSLLILAGDIIRPFAWVMTFGIFTGTFSSIFVASPILMWIEGKYPRLAPGTTAKAVTPVRA